MLPPVPDLVIGPLLRYVGETEAIVWVETDSPCEVEVLGTRDRTFRVAGHHYAVVCCSGLDRGTWHEYEVRLDGERVWPLEGFPPSVFHTYPKEEPLEVVFGSCRVAAPHEPPYSLRKDQDERGREVDSLHTLAERMLDEPRERWPDVLLMIGDQVYADEVSPATRAFIESRRDASGEPGCVVVDFEEYTQLYRESWTDDKIRWLLSTLSSMMIFDDHDVHDDWNSSQAWLEEMRTKEWWRDHIVAALASYWVYQHIGNLTPEGHADDELLRNGQGGRRRLADPRGVRARGRRAAVGHPLELLPRPRRHTRRRDRLARRARPRGGQSLDARRAGVAVGRGALHRGLRPPARRDLAAVAARRGDAPPRGLVGGGRGRGLGAGVRARSPSGCAARWTSSTGPRSRSRSSGWPSCCARSGAGERGRAPASIVVLSGDVHHAYLAEVAFRRGAGVRSHVFQAVCSPYRNPLEARERRVIRMGVSRPLALVTRALAASAGVDDPDVRWRMVGDGPWFDNQFATLRIDGREIEFRLEKAVPVDERSARLDRVLSCRLA